jgi:hypothetical protein
MSCRGNWRDKAVAESFFPLLKRERIHRKIYHIRDEAKQDVLITSRGSLIPNADRLQRPDIPSGI